MKPLFCFALSLLTISSATFSKAQLIDKRVTIQPIVVCADDGSQCSSFNLFEEATDKIWAQAGIDVDFVDTINYYHETTFLTVTTSPFAGNSFANLVGTPGHGQNASATVLNLWFVGNILTYAGFGLIGGNGMALDASGLTRIDAVAHELGHNLGLDHNTYGAGAAANLMSSPATAPSSVDNIYPDGGLLSTLNSSQIAVARASAFAISLPENEQYYYTPVPEPRAATALTALALCAWALLRNRRRNSKS
ncbi:MAG: hypothetical protein AB1813_06310 [Verrucomicrobiota bacterium]